MAYVPDANNAAEPLDSRDPSTAAAEFRALKAKVNALSPTTPAFGNGVAMAKLRNGSITTPRTYTVSGTTATISQSAHQYQVGEQVLIGPETGSAIAAGIYTITSVAANTFDITVASGTANGNCYVVLCATKLQNTSLVMDTFDSTNLLATVHFTFAAGLFNTGYYCCFSSPSSVSSQMLTATATATLTAGPFSAAGYMFTGIAFDSFLDLMFAGV